MLASRKYQQVSADLIIVANKFCFSYLKKLVRRKGDGRVSDGLCWHNGKQSRKPLLQPSGSRAAYVKRSSVVSLVNFALSRSCAPFVGMALEHQLVRLKNECYLTALLPCVFCDITLDLFNLFHANSFEGEEPSHNSFCLL